MTTFCIIQFLLFLFSTCFVKHIILVCLPSSQATKQLNFAEYLFFNLIYIYIIYVSYSAGINWPVDLVKPIVLKLFLFPIYLEFYPPCSLMVYLKMLYLVVPNAEKSFIVLTKVAKPRPPWLLVAMSHIFIIIATSALEFSRYKSYENNEDVHLWVRHFDLIDSRNSLS